MIDRLDLKNPKTILVVQIGKIGDMILTTPLFAELKKLFPSSKLYVLSSEINKDIALNIGAVEKVFVFRKNFLKNLFLLKSELNKIDFWIDTKEHYSKTSEALLKFFKPAHSFGYNSNRNIFEFSLNDFQLGNHAIDINLAPVNFISGNKGEVTMRRPSFTIPDKVKERFKHFNSKNSNRIVMNISAGNQSRYISPDKWISTIKKITERYISSFIIIGLKRDIKVIDSIISSTECDVQYIKTENILEVAEIISISSSVLTADTSIIHICSALNKPVVGLYPQVKWNLEKFAPLSNNYEVVISGNSENIEDIKAGEIGNAYFQLMDKINSGNAESRTRVRKEDH